MSLPENHMTTKERLKQIFKNKVIDEFLSSNYKCSNKIILNFLICITKNDNQLLGLSFLIERLATGGLLISDCPNIESFRNG